MVSHNLPSQPTPFIDRMQEPQPRRIMETIDKLFQLVGSALTLMKTSLNREREQTILRRTALSENC
jgi:hypothetical protein